MLSKKIEFVIFDQCFLFPLRAKILSDSFVVNHNLAEPVDFQASVSLALEPVRSKVMYDVSGDLFLMKVQLLCFNHIPDWIKHFIEFSL